MRPLDFWIAKSQTARICRSLAACALLAVLVPLPYAAAQTPIVTRNDTFYVPFTVPGNPAGAASHVELFVSGDRGKTWSLYQRRQPHEGRFSFRAGVDGEFWFAVRTIFPGGQADVAQVTRPELIVIVDRQQPKVELQARVDPQGQAVAEWSVTDTQLAPAGFRLECQVPGVSEWQPVDLGGQQQLLPSGQLAGQVTWWLPNNATHARLRLQASDRAGNTVVIARDLSSGQLSEVDELSRLPADPPAPVGSTLPAGPLAPNPSPAIASQAAERPQATFSPPPPGISQPTPPARSSDMGPSQPAAASEAMGGEQPAIAGDSPAAAGVPVPNASLPGYRSSRVRQFQLDYEIESRDRSSVYRVEIWYTADGGRTWRHYGDDEDRQSPAVVQVSADGIYGFRLIIQAKEGLAARPPQQGDPADVWIRVDATPPTARLTSAQYGRGTQLGVLHILWDAEDADLSDQPITLLYSADPQGPWRKIADQLPNTGRFDWQPDDRTPERVYLRLEVRDRAGNVGVETLLDAIRSDGLAPQGRIRDVRPLPSPGP